jgi:ubiquinone biosynthesis O-methyltransferase
LLDVGCGGGILSESLARMGADVTGVDAAAANVEIAKTHVSADPALAKKITYRAAAAETLLAERASFDAVVALEIIEHVSDPDAFVRCLAGLTDETGAVIVSTLNRTARSAALAIAFAERIANWVPPGTHEFSKFVAPDELATLAARAGLETREAAGMAYTPPLPGAGAGATGGEWRLTADDMGVNYIAYFAKKPT